MKYGFNIGERVKFNDETGSESIGKILEREKRDSKNVYCISHRSKAFHEIVSEDSIIYSLTKGR